MCMILTILIYIENSRQIYNTNIKYNDNYINAMCNDTKQPIPLSCQPVYKPQLGNVGMIHPQVNNNIGFVNPPLVQTVTPSIPNNIPTQTVLSSTPLPGVHMDGISAGQKLSAVLSENPIAKTQLINFLEYNGVPPPWDQLLDFETTQHHQLPDPDTLFRKIRKQLLTFENVKTCIVEGLIVIEKYINRGKAYLAEDLKDLCRDKTVLQNILKRLRTKPTYEFRSELFKRYADVKTRSFSTQKSFYKLRDWLLKIKKLFATL